MKRAKGVDRWTKLAVKIASDSLSKSTSAFSSTDAREGGSRRTSCGSQCQAGQVADLIPGQEFALLGAYAPPTGHPEHQPNGPVLAQSSRLDSSGVLAARE